MFDLTIIYVVAIEIKIYQCCR